MTESMGYISRDSSMPVKSVFLTGKLFSICGALLSVIVAVGVVTPAAAQTKRHPHGRLQNDLLTKMQDVMMLAETKTKANAKRANVARNASGTYEAFTLDVPTEGDENNLREAIFVEDKRQRKIYELKGFDFPRPFADLAWSNNNTLIFDQWMQPHSGVHYGVDVSRNKLIAAATFSERGRKR